MKIFISWSKSNSNAVALALRKFIENVFDNIEEPIQFFISSEDIYAGNKWFEVISTELRTSQLAIICLTAENKFSKWLDFESGAVAMNSQHALVCPFLFNMEELDHSNPLTQFQVTKNNAKEIKKLIETIAKQGNIRLSNKHFEKIFPLFYSELEREFNDIVDSTDDLIQSEYFDKHIYPVYVKGTYGRKLFLGTPMASIESKQYLENRLEVMTVIDEIQKFCKIDQVYSPVVNNKEPEAFDGQEKAMEIDFAELKQSEYYVFIYPEKVVSSILVEIGYAIALLKKTIIFVKSRKDLPFMLEKCEKRNRNIKIYEYKDFKDLRKQIRVEGEFMFKFN